MFRIAYIFQILCCITSIALAFSNHDIRTGQDPDVVALTNRQTFCLSSQEAQEVGDVFLGFFSEFSEQVTNETVAEDLQFMSTAYNYLIDAGCTAGNVPVWSRSGTDFTEC